MNTIINRQVIEKVSLSVRENREYIKESGYATIAEYLLEDLQASGNYTYYLGVDFDDVSLEDAQIMVKELKEYIECEYSLTVAEYFGE